MQSYTQRTGIILLDKYLGLGRESTADGANWQHLMNFGIVPSYFRTVDFPLTAV